MSAVDGQGTRLLYLLVDLPHSGGHSVAAVVSQKDGLLHIQARASTARRFERFVADSAQGAGTAAPHVAKISTAPCWTPAVSERGPKLRRR